MSYRRFGPAAVALVAVLTCQLVPPFIYNRYDAYVAIFTIAALLGLPRLLDGRIVGVVTLAIAAGAVGVANQMVQRELGTWLGSSDFEDGVVMVGFGAGSLGGIALATWLARTSASPRQVRGFAITYAAAFAVALVAFVACVTRMHQLNRTSDVMVAGASLATSVVLGLLAWHTQRIQGPAVDGRHKGDGWIDLDDGTPPLHRPELASTEAGPVVVHGVSKKGAAGYRDGSPRTGAMSVETGTVEELRQRGRTRAAARLAVGAAVAVMGSLKLFAVAHYGIGVFFGGDFPRLPVIRD